MRLIRCILLVLALAALVPIASCDHRSPTEPLPAATLMTKGHWASEAMCLEVSDSTVSIGAGCGRGTFSRPVIGIAGDFTADGTFDVSVGPPPVTPQPPQAAHFTGTVSGNSVTLTIKTATRTYGTMTATLGSSLGCPAACP